jgi:hypothetical protein
MVVHFSIGNNAEEEHGFFFLPCHLTPSPSGLDR